MRLVLISRGYGFVLTTRLPSNSSPISISNEWMLRLPLPTVVEQRHLSSPFSTSSTRLTSLVAKG